MVKSANGAPQKTRRFWILLLGLLALALFMYVSIIYKIIHFGP